MTSELKEQVRQRYAEAAKGGGGCCDESCCGEDFGEALYSAEQLEQLPGAAALASLGCGNPTAVADLHPGELRRRDRRPALRQAGRPDRQGLRPRHDRRDARARAAERP